LSLVRWPFALIIGVLGAVLEASSLLLLEVSKAAAASVSALPYLLLVLSVPYLATSRHQRWWLSTWTTLGMAWLILLLASFPALFVASWLVAAEGDTYFVVMHTRDYLLIGAPAGAAVLGALSFILGGIARLVARSPAA
jgi:hypothetical protein